MRISDNIAYSLALVNNIIEAILKFLTNCRGFNVNFCFLRYAYAFKNYTNQEVDMALDLAKKRELISKFGRNDNDTGSVEVQVALITERITYLTEHLKVFKKDHSSRLGLLKLVGQRKRLLKYLKRTDIKRYATLIGELKIKDKI